MGNRKYNAYINSARWAKLRETKLDMVGHKCEFCQRTFVQLHCHHMRYRNLEDCIPSDLMVLCIDCHNDFHAGCRTLGKSVKDFDTTTKVCSVIYSVRNGSLAAKLSRQPRNRIGGPMLKNLKRAWAAMAGSQFKIEYARRLLLVLKDVIDTAETEGFVSGGTRRAS